MKRLFLFLSLLMMISACSGKVYENTLQMAYDSLENKQYEEALQHFEKAAKDKSTEDTEIGVFVSQSMIEAEQAFAVENWDTVIEKTSYLLEDSRDNKALSLVKEEAERMHDEAFSYLQDSEDEQ